MDDLPWDLQQERRPCVAADAARKRSAHRWTNWGLPPPVSLLRRETEECDLLHGLLPPPPPPPAAPTPPAPPVPPPQIGEGSSSGSWSFSGAGSSPRTPLLARQVTVDEDGFKLYDPGAFEGSVTREDFVPDEVLAMVTSAVQARSEREVQDDAKRRCCEVDLEQLLFEQGLEQDRLHREQDAAKTREKEKGKAVVIYVDDDSEEE